MTASSSRSGSSATATLNVGGNNYDLNPSNIRENAEKYMQWLDRGTARMHALGVVDNHDNYTDDMMLHGGSLAYFTTRNAVQRVTNDQGNKSRVELSAITSQLSTAQQKMVVDSVRRGIEDWYNKDSQTKAGAAAYRKLRKSYNPDTRTYG